MDCEWCQKQLARLDVGETFVVYNCYKLLGSGACARTVVICDPRWIRSDAMSAEEGGPFRERSVVFLLTTGPFGGRFLLSVAALEPKQLPYAGPRILTKLQGVGWRATEHLSVLQVCGEEGWSTVLNLEGTRLPLEGVAPDSRRSSMSVWMRLVVPREAS